MKIITPVGTLSFPSLFTPQDPFDSGRSKYSASIVFDPGTDLSELEAAIETVAKEKFGPGAVEELRKGKLRHPIRDDGESKGYEAGARFFSAKTTRTPGVVDRYADPKTGKARIITSPDEMYPGAKVRFSVSPYAYAVRGNKGVAISLNHVQKWGEGERLDGRGSAEDAFSFEQPVTTDLGDFDSAEDPMSAYS